MANGLGRFYPTGATSGTGNFLPRINAAQPGYGDPLQTINNLQNLKMNQMQIKEQPNVYNRAAAEEKRRAATETRTAESHQWESEDRVVTQEMKALREAISQKDSADARAVYDRLRPKGNRAKGLPQPTPKFSRQGGLITIDGGPGQLVLQGPEGAVSRLLEEVEKYPQAVKDPEMFKKLAATASKMGISLKQNPEGKWAPGSKEEALELAAAKKTSATADKTQARIDRLRKEMPRLASLREQIKKGDKLEQILKILSPEARDQMGIGPNESKEAAIAKIDEYEKWVRIQLRQAESGSGSDDPLGLRSLPSGAAAVK